MDITIRLRNIAVVLEVVQVPKIKKIQEKKRRAKETAKKFDLSLSTILFTVVCM